MASIAEVLNILADLATVLGIPVAILVFLNEKHQERREREYGTYHALDEKYQDFLSLCMENPELDLYDIPLDLAMELTAEQRVRQYALFDILASLLERAYLMYRDQSSQIKRQQWLGWEKYFRDYAAHPTFRRLWAERGIEFDARFCAYMQDTLQATAAPGRVGEK